MLVGVLFVKGQGKIDGKHSDGDGARDEARKRTKQQLETETYLSGGLRFDKEGLVCTHQPE